METSTEQRVWSGLRWQRAQMRPADAAMRVEFRRRMELRGQERDCSHCGWPTGRPSREYDQLLIAAGAGRRPPGCFDPWHDVAEGVIQDLRHGGDVGAGIGSGATFSQDRRYRYELRRRWAQNGLTVGWLMANPSVAGEDVDDPTIRKVCGFSQRWGFGGAVIWNLRAGVATDPKELLLWDDPVGPDNTRYLQKAAYAPLLVCAWGDAAPEGRALDTVTRLQQFGANFANLGFTSRGNPRHPARLPYATELLAGAFS